MKQENLRLLVAAALGAATGLILGMYLFSEQERKVRLSKHMAGLSELLQELEELKTDEANQLKDKVKSILNSVQDLLDQKDGKPE